jgi:hypothetical protein
MWICIDFLIYNVLYWCLSGLFRVFFGACSTLVRHFFDPIESENSRTRVEESTEMARTRYEHTLKTDPGKVEALPFLPAEKCLLFRKI